MPAGLIAFRGVDAVQADPLAVHVQRVPINDPGTAAQHLRDGPIQHKLTDHIQEQSLENGIVVPERKDRADRQDCCQLYLRSGAALGFFLTSSASHWRALARNGKGTQGAVVETCSLDADWHMNCLPPHPTLDDFDNTMSGARLR
ncbi:hypothetical protein [Paracoccus sp. Ld10]|uniref:hypothetical protein n=1 Tax=Paracoccus sp. Ld10 TaxID=649158 RepID=UPI003864DF70